MDRRTDRIAALDGLRAIAIALVMVHHFALVDRPTPALAAVVGAMHTGWIGVDLFFVISGFLITGICLDHAGPGFFRAFYGRRVLRIVPPYVALLAVACAVSLAGSGAMPRGLGWMATFSTNIAQGRANDFNIVPPTLTHLWSLAVEEQFYLLWPAALVLLPRRAAIALAALALPGALAYRSVLIGAGSTIGAHVLTLARLDALAVGALVAFTVRTRHAARLGPRALWVAVITIPLGIVVGGALRYTCFAVGFGAVVVGAITATKVAPLLWRPVQWVGQRSYGIYLIHLPVAATLYAAGFRPQSALALAAFGVVAAVASCALAELGWRTVEAPALKYKSRFGYNHATITAKLGAPEPGAVVREFTT